LRIISLLIPLSRFTVEYEVQVGRPCSELDELILRSIAEEAASMKEMEERFKLRSRLLIEILITLFTQGWISISMERGRDFNITRQGLAVLDDGKLPEIRRGWERSGVVMMERLTGALIPQRDVVFESGNELRRSRHWEHAHSLHPRVTENRLDAGQVIAQLYRHKHEWVRNISRPVLASDYWWLPVDVDLETGSAVGLPDRWAQRLKPLLFEEAEAIASTMPEEAAARPYWHQGREQQHPRAAAETAYPDWCVSLRASSDILLSPPAHAALLREALATAKSAVFISSPELATGRAADKLSMELMGALRRGVSIDLLWGDTTEGIPRTRAQAVDWLYGLAAEAQQAGATGQLRFNAEPSTVQSALLIYDLEETNVPRPATSNAAPALSCRAYLGSYGWLAPETNEEANDSPARHLTIGVSHPETVASVCRSVAAVVSTHFHGRFAASDRWNNFAEELQKTPGDDLPAWTPDAAPMSGGDDVQEAEHACRIRLVYNYEHRALADSLLRAAQERCALVSSLDRPAFEGLNIVVKRRASGAWAGELMVTCGDKEEPGGDDRRASEEGSWASGASVVRREGLQAELLIADATVLTGQYAPPERGASGRGSAWGINLTLEGRSLADHLWNSFGGEKLG
jgi:hypothetical protein